LWEHIKDECTASEKTKNGPKPEAVYKHAEDALTTLASQWKVQFDAHRDKAAGKPFIPPVMIVVCDNTDVAQVIYEKIAGERDEEIPNPDNPKKTVTVKRFGSGRVFPDLLANTENEQHTIRIDSKLLAKLESTEGETKDQAALRLRELIDTVGKHGGLGEQVRCVVSVSMLTEGWDANNVTHILGIRAFGSQLLCEQVVGRGLRRMSYVPDPETGLLPAEYADVYGIPFSLIPYKGKPKEQEERPDPIYHAIHAMEERADFEIRLPVVESYVYDLRAQGIICDIDSLEPLLINKTPGKVWIRPPRGYQEDTSAPSDTGDLVEQTRDEYYKTVRPQQLMFRLAQGVLDDLMQGVQSENESNLAELRLRAKNQLFPELLTIVKKYIANKVTFRDGLDPRELGLEIYFRQVVERIRDNILPATSETGRLIPILNRFRPHNSTADVNYQTTRPVVDLTKSHLNRAMVQSGAETGDYEVGAIEIFEEMDCVDCYTPNDRQVGLLVPYDYDGESKSYEPDFIIKLRGDVTLMLEIKGEGGRIHNRDQVFAKNAAAKKWCDAVSNLGRYGNWAYEICDDLTTLRDMLIKHSSNGKSLPFEVVDAASATPWETCVPLVSLRTLVTKPEAQQLLVGGAWETDLIRWDGQPTFTKGMFVAKVHGNAMEPTIPAGSYCLFQPVTEDDHTAKVLFINHYGLNDPHTGGSWTIRRFESRNRKDENEEWSHDRIVLSPDNVEFPPFTLEIKSEENLEVLGEFVSVLSEKSPVEETEMVATED